MKNLITAAIISIAATSAQADTANDFAECVMSGITAEYGVTLDQFRAVDPAMVRETQDSLVSMANEYLEIPNELKAAARFITLRNVPQAVSCLSILEG